MGTVKVILGVMVLAVFLNECRSQTFTSYAKTCNDCNSTNANCNPKGDYVVCSCKAGFIGDGLNCTKIVFCDSLPCCPQGYTWDISKKVCTDINECVPVNNVLNKCDPASCTNRNGIFLCGNTIGASCNGNICSPDMDCIKSNGVASCSDPCSTKQFLTGPRRLYTLDSLGRFANDRHNYGWVRFTDGYKMKEGCTGPLKCGSLEPYSLGGSHPPIADGIQIIPLKINGLSGCTNGASIPVKACPGGYYVYKFFGSLKFDVYCSESTTIPTHDPTTINTSSTSASSTNINTSIITPTSNTTHTPITSPTSTNINTSITTPTSNTTITPITSPTSTNTDTPITSPNSTNINTSITTPTINTTKTPINTSNSTTPITPITTPTNTTPTKPITPVTIFNTSCLTIPTTTTTPPTPITTPNISTIPSTTTSHTTSNNTPCTNISFTTQLIPSSHPYPEDNITVTHIQSRSLITVRILNQTINQKEVNVLEINETVTVTIEMKTITPSFIYFKTTVSSSSTLINVYLNGGQSQSSSDQQDPVVIKTETVIPNTENFHPDSYCSTPTQTITSIVTSSSDGNSCSGIVSSLTTTTVTATEEITVSGPNGIAANCA